jgi:hypothetical protein
MRQGFRHESDGLPPDIASIARMMPAGGSNSLTQQNLFETVQNIRTIQAAIFNQFRMDFYFQFVLNQ